MRNSESFMRMRTLQVIVLLIFALIVGRLAYIQLFDSRYDDLARESPSTSHMRAVSKPCLPISLDMTIRS